MYEVQKQQALSWQAEIEGRDAAELVAWALARLGADQVVLASSFGAEDQVLTHMLTSVYPQPRIITLDTGRQFAETYQTMDRTMRRYGIRYEVCAPDAAELAAMISEYGPDLFYAARDLRRLCCEVRKINPLRRALKTARLWMCGLRREQCRSRAGVQLLEWDEQFLLFKLNPLRDWTAAQVWDYIHQQAIPYNPLHDRGYPSIGCAPCTRAVAAGEDIRAGRWWWEQAEKKECGLHRPEGATHG